MMLLLTACEDSDDTGNTVEIDFVAQPMDGAAETAAGREDDH